MKRLLATLLAATLWPALLVAQPYGEVDPYSLHLTGNAFNGIIQSNSGTIGTVTVASPLSYSGTTLDLNEAANYTWTGSHTYVPGAGTPWTILPDGLAPFTRIFYIYNASEETPIADITTADSHWYYPMTVHSNLTVTGTTTLATSLTGIAKLTSGTVGIASSADLLSAIGTIDISANTNLAVSSPITLTGDTVGFDFGTANTWTNTNSFSADVTHIGTNRAYFNESYIYSPVSATLQIDGKTNLVSSILGTAKTTLTATDLTLASGVNLQATQSKGTYVFNFGTTGHVSLSGSMSAATGTFSNLTSGRITHASTSGLLTDTAGFAISAGNVAISTNYSPSSIYKLLVQNRSTAASPGSNFAALSSSFEYLPAATTTTMANNLHGYEGGIGVFATNGSISGGGAFFGLRGNATVLLGNSTTNSNTATGLFGSFSASQGTGTGGTQSGVASSISTFFSVGANSTVTNGAHLRIGTSSNSGTLTTLYGIYVPQLTAATSNYEVWLDSAARTYYRAATQYVYSSAANTLDLNAGTTYNERIGGNIATTLTATRLTLNGSGVDPYIDWATSSQMWLVANTVRMPFDVQVGQTLTFDAGGVFYDYSSTWFSMSGSGTPDDGTNFYIPYDPSNGWYFGYGMGSTDPMYFGTTGLEFVIYGNGNLDVGGGGSNGLINFADVSGFSPPGGYDPGSPDGYINVRIEGGSIVAIPYWAT